MCLERNKAFFAPRLYSGVDRGWSNNNASMMMITCETLRNLPKKASSNVLEVLQLRQVRGCSRIIVGNFGLRYRQLCEPDFHTDFITIGLGCSTTVYVRSNRNIIDLCHHHHRSNAPLVAGVKCHLSLLFYVQDRAAYPVSRAMKRGVKIRPLFLRLYSRGESTHTKYLS